MFLFMFYPLASTEAAAIVAAIVVVAVAAITTELMIGKCHYLSKSRMADSACRIEKRQPVGHRRGARRITPCSACAAAVMRQVVRLEPRDSPANRDDIEEWHCYDLQQFACSILQPSGLIDASSDYARSFNFEECKGQ